MDILKEIDKRQERIRTNKEKTREAIKQEILFSGSNSEQERKLFEKFKSKHKGERFVKLEHFDSLGVPYDVLFISSIKNIGKTRNIVFNRFDYYYKKGKKVIYMRTTLSEFERHLPEFNASKYNPFFIRKTKSVWFLFHKETGEECGICVDLKKCNSISGGEFEDYEAIIYDEALTWSPVNEINKSHLFNFFALFSSVQRNKPNLKVYLTSNLPPTNKNLLLLDYLGISIDDDLKYFSRKNVNNDSVACNFLYVNVGDTYLGINDQGGPAQLANQAAKLLLGSNKIVSSYDNTIGDNILGFLKPKFAFAFSIPGNEVFLIYLKYIEDIETNRLVYCLHCCLFDPYYYTDCPVFTDCNFVASIYGKSVKKIASITGYLNFVIKLIDHNKLSFTNDNSLLFAKKIYDAYKKENICFW